MRQSASLAVYTCVARLSRGSGYAATVLAEANAPTATDVPPPTPDDIRAALATLGGAASNGTASVSTTAYSYHICVRAIPASDGGRLPITIAALLAVPTNGDDVAQMSTADRDSCFRFLERIIGDEVYGTDLTGATFEHALQTEMGLTLKRMMAQFNRGKLGVLPEGVAIDDAELLKAERVFAIGVDKLRGSAAALEITDSERPAKRSTRRCCRCCDTRVKVSIVSAVLVICISMSLLYILLSKFGVISF